MRSVVVLACTGLLVTAGTASAKVGPIPIVTTSDGLWSATAAGEVVRIEGTSGRVLERTSSLGFPYALAGARGRLWAIDGRGNRAVRISASGSIAATRGLPGFPSALAVGDTSVWTVAYEGPQKGTSFSASDPDSLMIRGPFRATFAGSP